MRRYALTVILLLVAAAALPASSALAQPEAALEGRAVLPADTFAEGPSSGAKLEDETKGGRTPPFEGQPVGGISAVLDEADGGYLAMADNGFGKKDNSADFLLRAYRFRPDFETTGGGGEIPGGEEFVELRDPEGYFPFGITNEDSEERLLTGADFDIESVRRDDRGNLWFGDEPALSCCTRTPRGGCSKPRPAAGREIAGEPDPRRRGGAEPADEQGLRGYGDLRGWHHPVPDARRSLAG